MSTLRIYIRGCGLKILITYMEDTAMLNWTEDIKISFNFDCGSSIKPTNQNRKKENGKI